MKSLLFFWKQTAIILLRSVSSIRFYHNVLKDYRGYGIKYVITMCSLSIIAYGLLMISHFNQITNYLTQNQISTTLQYNLNYILKQFPNIEFDGQNIKIESLEQSKKLLITDLSQTPQVEINLADKINNSNVLFTLNQNEINSRLNTQASIKYNSLFGNQPITINQDILKNQVGKFLSSRQLLLKCIIFPICLFVILLIKLVYTLLNIIFITCIIYVITNLLLIRITFNNVIRLCAFASGPGILFPVFFIPFTNNISVLELLFDFIAYALMIISIILIVRKKY